MSTKGPWPRRRPIEAWEEPFLEACGALLRRYRDEAGLTLTQMRLATGVSRMTWFRLDHAERRPRHSTLRRAARALAAAAPSLGSPESIADELIAALGPVHAPESRHLESIERRRDRHVGKLARDPAADLRPPPSEKIQLQRQLRLAQRELYALRRQRREVEAKEEELRLKEEALDRLDRQIQAREIDLAQRRRTG